MNIVYRRKIKNRKKKKKRKIFLNRLYYLTIKKYKKRGGYGSAKTYQTNPPITKSND